MATFFTLLFYLKNPAKSTIDKYPQGVYNCDSNIPPRGIPTLDTRGNDMTDNCCCRTKERSDKEFKDLMNRLKRIEGQVKGVQRMLEENAYCPDIMIQVAAINSALNSFNKVLLAEHLKTCVVDDIKAGREDTIEELTETLKKVMK